MWPTLECWCWCLTEPLARTWRLYIPSVGGGTGYPRPPGHTTATSSRTQGENGHKKWGLVDSLDRRWMPSWLDCVVVCLMMSDVRMFGLFRKAVMCDCWHVQSTQHIMDRCYLLYLFLVLYQIMKVLWSILFCHDQQCRHCPGQLSVRSQPRRCPVSRQWPGRDLGWLAPHRKGSRSFLFVLYP